MAASDIPDDIRAANRERAREIAAQAPAELTRDLREELGRVFIPTYRRIARKASA